MIEIEKIENCVSEKMKMLGHTLSHRKLLKDILEDDVRRKGYGLS